MSETDGLPVGWLQAKLGDILRIRNGFAFKSSDFQALGVPLIRQSNIGDGYIDISDAKRLPPHFLQEHAEFVVRKGDYLIGMSGSLGKLGEYQDDEPALQNQRTGLLVAEPLSPSRFVRYALAFVEPQIVAEGKGIAVQNVSAQEIEDCQLPLPPLNEQSRIVAKLEELLSDLDAGVAELKAAQKKLTQYRHSLLKAAVAGALTAEWRKHNKPKETGAQLLERILKARRARWEEKQLTQFKKRADRPPKGWQEKYPEPVKPDVRELSKLPEGWVWASVDCLLAEIETGKSFKCEERPPRQTEVGVIKVSAVSWGEYDESESKTCVDPTRIEERIFVRPGDFLFSRANTIELVGACVVAKDVNSRVMLSDKILRFIFLLNDLKLWLLSFLRSELGRQQIELLSSGNQESMRNIGQEKIRQIAVPLPPANEIAEIASMIESGMSVIAQSDIGIGLMLRQSAAQRKNILKAAFSGQLVPQDPNDEPARVLLERIRAERLARAPSTARRAVKKRA